MPTRRRIALPHGWVSALEWLPDGEPRTTVVLLHGAGYDNATLSWAQTGAALAAAGCRVVAPELPGFGASPPSDLDGSLASLVRHTADVVEALDLDEHVVGGLSLGGGIALGYALERPAGLRGVMALGSYGIMPRLRTGPLALPTQLLMWAMTRTGPIDGLFRWYARDERRMRRSIAQIVRTPANVTDALVADAVAEGVQGTSLRITSAFQRSEVLPTRQRTDHTPLLASLAVPALLVHGTHDVGVAVEHARTAAARIPDATLLVVDDGGHWIQRDRPDLVHPAMLAFVERVA
ncbi:alpha/beta fold hydrolase [Agrococcus jejuensis]|uniref:alpha/beta fold hydrolase n=1 Tax=Agrococcus jejuensis TaxID=399736 RepID=UPI0011A1BA70|nr:alpha/beta hydrolase [Agrococcus jejuensis]